MSIIRYVMGWIMIVEGLLMGLPCGVAVVCGEGEGRYFAAVAAGTLALGLALARRPPASSVFSMREGCIAAALGWIVLSLAGCLPFWLSGEIPSFTDALFETVSGFTTTGATILSDVEGLSRCMLFWRSFTHWIGGMGVLVFLLAVVRMPGGCQMNLMRAESPGPAVGKLRPKAGETARLLYLIYLGLTVLELLFLLAGRMPLFDALTVTFGSAGTGGFAIKNDSIMGYSPYLQWVVTVFMALFGVNFNLYYLLLFRRWRQALRLEEVHSYFLILLGAILLVLADLRNTGLAFWDALRHASFQVVSIMTTTGFATVDFNQWPQLARSVLVLLMFVGACGGSTGGGIKVSRVVVMVKTMCKELHTYVFPGSVRKIQMDGRPVEREVVWGINVFFAAFMLIFSLSVLGLSLEGRDMVTNFTAVAATFNNIGPGLELVGPRGNFGLFSPLSKYILMFDMLAGRLELFPMLLLLYPPCWKGALRRRRMPAEERCFLNHEKRRTRWTAYFRYFSR